MQIFFKVETCWGRHVWSLVEGPSPPASPTALRTSTHTSYERTPVMRLPGSLSIVAGACAGNRYRPVSNDHQHNYSKRLWTKRQCPQTNSNTVPSTAIRYRREHVVDTR